MVEIIDDAAMTSAFLPGRNGALHLWNTVKKQHPRNQLVAVQDCLDLDLFFEAKDVKMTHCSEHQHAHLKLSSLQTGQGNIVDYYLGGNTALLRGETAKLTAKDYRSELQNGAFTVQYDGQSFLVYTFEFQSGMEWKQMWLLSFAGADDLAGRKLLADAYAWQGTLKDEMWVYHGAGGGWRKDKSFYKAVKNANPDDIVLPEATMQNLVRDTNKFFQSASLYKSLGVTWKRGVLLLGPPGNGKTGVIKALLKMCERFPALYVQSAKTQRGAEWGMQTIFAKARKEAPCILVLEDIDTLVEGDTRSFMLNQLDGIEPNDGILVIATANDASKLDEAILHRPSRFDTKYSFNLPDAALRKRFINKWLEEKVKHSTLIFDEKHRNTDTLSAALVEKTEGWSFAFLKELFLSFLLGIASHDGSEARASVAELLHHVDVLHEQTKAAE
ncbi:P-loop containing nucleoside triphosphate hydrolase protein [Acaromyces ingoldii]|uniref:P-loop containing nucleoside triphosphate hydrolase protein n=1 Tax=Acaromyces ingoldii TaxID=215250 RepID=A0A316YDM1_9BASI|nr:P-loop containing nucleoside triphosphate hydrolase protein [Acaromyces ingoldii]PWN87231.1 P-loop containing nucleoside triphosphate hydrolase protein [Acaromyces ingoldii]